MKAIYKLHDTIGNATFTKLSNTLSGHRANELLHTLPQRIIVAHSIIKQKTEKAPQALRTQFGEADMTDPALTVGNIKKMAYAMRVYQDNMCNIELMSERRSDAHKRRNELRRASMYGTTEYHKALNDQRDLTIAIEMVNGYMVYLIGDRLNAK